MQPLVQTLFAPAMLIIWLISAAILSGLWWMNRRPARASDGTPIAPVAIQMPADLDPPAGRGRQLTLSIVVMLCFFGGMLLNLRSIAAVHHSGAFGWVLILIFFGYTLFIGNLKKTGFANTMKYVSAAQYDQAIGEADRVLRWFPRALVFTELRAAALRAAGRLDEAERGEARNLRRVQAIGNRRLQAVALEALGKVYLDQRRFNEAQAVFESAMQLDPNYGSPYCSLAETQLRQGHDPARALELLDKGIPLKEAEMRLPAKYRNRFGDAWAVRADALARLGRIGEADSSLAKAAAMADPAMIPDMAGILWRSGEALRHMNRESDAAAQFKRAADIDPNGLYGKRAADSLRGFAFPG